jgi:triacylglycerol lipase
MSTSTNPRAAVLLVHGIGANRLVMWPLQLGLQRHGFQVCNLGYNSLKSIGETSYRVEAALRSLADQSQLDSIHLVGHSMGCILGRVALARFKPERFQRMVMLTPPSKGSPVADWLAPALGWCVPPLRELRTGPNSFVNRLPPPDYPFAVVRATWDFLIPRDYEILMGAADHLEVSALHSMVLIHRRTIDQVAHFLKTGAFSGPSAPPSASHRDPGAEIDKP